MELSNYMYIYVLICLLITFIPTSCPLDESRVEFLGEVFEASDDRVIDIMVANETDFYVLTNDMRVCKSEEIDEGNCREVPTSEMDSRSATLENVTSDISNFLITGRDENNRVVFCDPQNCITRPSEFEFAVDFATRGKDEIYIYLVSTTGIMEVFRFSPLFSMGTYDIGENFTSLELSGVSISNVRGNVTHNVCVNESNRIHSFLLDSGSPDTNELLFVNHRSGPLEVVPDNFIASIVPNEAYLIENEELIKRASIGRYIDVVNPEYVDIDYINTSSTLILNPFQGVIAFTEDNIIQSCNLRTNNITEPLETESPIESRSKTLFYYEQDSNDKGTFGEGIIISNNIAQKFRFFGVLMRERDNPIKPPPGMRLPEAINLKQDSYQYITIDREGDEFSIEPLFVFDRYLYSNHTSRSLYVGYQDTNIIETFDFKNKFILLGNFFEEILLGASFITLSEFINGGVSNPFSEGSIQIMSTIIGEEGIGAIQVTAESLLISQVIINNRLENIYFVNSSESHEFNTIDLDPGLTTISKIKLGDEAIDRYSVERSQLIQSRYYIIDIDTNSGTATTPFNGNVVTSFNDRVVYYGGNYTCTISMDTVTGTEAVIFNNRTLINTTTLSCAFDPEFVELHCGDLATEQPNSYKFFSLNSDAEILNTFTISDYDVMNYMFNVLTTIIIKPNSILTSSNIFLRGQLYPLTKDVFPFWAVLAIIFASIIIPIIAAAVMWAINRSRFARVKVPHNHGNT